MDEKKFNDITLDEHVESEKARELYNEMSSRYSALYLFILVPLILFVIFFVSNKYVFTTASIVALAGFGVTLVIIAAVVASLLEPYREIYKRALKNDEIRYDEKIRFLERKRLESEYNNKNSRKNIKKSLEKQPKEVDGEK